MCVFLNFSTTRTICITFWTIFSFQEDIWASIHHSLPSSSPLQVLFIFLSTFSSVPGQGCILLLFLYSWRKKIPLRGYINPKSFYLHCRMTKRVKNPTSPQILKNVYIALHAFKKYLHINKIFLYCFSQIFPPILHS